MIHIIKTPIWLVLLSCTALQMYPPEPTSAEEWPVGARALGMGATYVALANTADAVFLNIGGLSQLVGAEISMFYQKPFGISELNFGTLAVSFPIRNRRVGLGVLSFGNGLYREQAVTLSYSHHYQRKLYYGVGVHYTTVRIDGYGSSGAPGLDLGLVLALTPELQLGFVAKNVNRPTIGQAGENLPQTFCSGAAVQSVKNLIVNFEIFKDVRFSPEVRFGCEFKPLPNLALRTGMANHPSRFSAGFGITLKRISVDYAFFTHNDLGLTHQSSLSLRLGKQPQPPTPEPKPVVDIAAPESPGADSTQTAATMAAAKTPPAIIKINEASMEQLKTLPGIGESLARAIVEFRQHNGRFQSLDDLLKVPGIGKSKLEKIRAYLIIDDVAEK